MRWKLLGIALGGFIFGANAVLLAICALRVWEIRTLGVDDWLAFNTQNVVRDLTTAAVGGTFIAGLFAWLVWKHPKGPLSP
jgi:hypothetical protein